MLYFPCNYNLNIRASDTIDIEFDSQFNLYVTDKNKEIDVVFYSDKKDKDIPYISLYAIGNKNPEVTLQSHYEYKKYSKNNIFKITLFDSTNTNYTLKIKARIW